MISGILNVYKERGMTSHDVIGKIRRITGERKAGHTGTLDPEADGVLPVCLGRATKVCGLITDSDKTYRAVMQLGVSTDTQDATGTVTARAPVLCSEEEALAALLSFTGSYDQLTPMYSARKVGGRHLYELARAGVEVERESRRVTIMEIVPERVRLPEITFLVTCSRGTYIRTLCSDAGDRLGCGAMMKSLTRTRCGRFSIEESLRFEQIEEAVAEGRLQELLLGADEMFEDLPAMQIAQGAERFLKNGNALRPGMLTVRQEPEGAEPPRGGMRIRVYDEGGAFAAIYRYDEGCGLFAPEKMFL